MLFFFGGGGDILASNSNKAAKQSLLIILDVKEECESEGEMEEEFPDTDVKIEFNRLHFVHCFLKND